MALRKFMHPRNKYKQGPDFKKLAILYPDFRKHTTTDLSGKIRYDFKNVESLQILAKTLLKHDFDLDIDIPTEKLVPVMPLRLNYVLWIEDLLTYAKFTDEIHGVDIGTGAVSIYPLLCSKMYGWKMTGTEINETSVLSAKNNVAKNGQTNLIKVMHVKDDSSLLNEALEESVEYTFTMCNPPFFNTNEFIKREKRLPPRNAATGSGCELVVEGGEKCFVTRLLCESLELQERVKIYTTMLGQKSSCAFFRSEMKKRNITNYTWTEFCQGHTKRWGLAWTFIPKEIIDLTNAPVIRTRDSCQTIKQSKDRPSEMVFPLGDKFHSVDQLVETLCTWIQELKIEMEELEVTEKEIDGWTFRLKAYEDTWSHARRKRRMAQRQEQYAKKSRVEISGAVRNDVAFTEEQETRETESSPPTVRPTNSLLECCMIVGEFENNDTEEESEDVTLVKICILYEDGHGGKNAMETFRQYLINKLCIREYLMGKSKSNSPKKKKRRDKRIETGVSD
ncbi:U6 small nuclear RNA (adenine-(43)-N(6))-methyltransferase [Venturia canescens]|uniref:U6 small nuclear RNA (adenine-(43)-N(6))-methyltransferase n=1 Tax=Venturia canescens TaxID=32260 RepID=UPI001C9C3596|nr:U6 small nuclear RNA (adenine-(43)-N(6))-methyltransferase [Venturia canescens]